MSNFKLHELKISEAHFEDVLAGRKTHEVRINDRNYQVGDVLHLQEIDENRQFTGQALNACVTHILKGGQYGLADDWCVLSLGSITATSAKLLIEFLRDRLEETCDCIEYGYEFTRKAGCTTADAEKTVEGGRAFIAEANAYLKNISEVAA
ncbi:TPA: DUF3850 domain-containing protein [Vibrio parahaemolyticus]|uniref:DUF3850 domain-containing protein n=1 Tax=Vibrio parahaemolyticus TaxID=670 RepID=UPI0002A570BF|nr:DUF3850 domain-containing protein [Vibrio parahaemolyticus]AGB11011.1 hypothetical protein VPBB_2555 [Vibrio parahaemolyticus BB22OP]MBE4138101.1 DUF3850 domain-containing protein [Vibrio parahaemolyticus]MQF42697.1 DUF3850 domain-containing protein [Vibrio parahaemolyticus]TOZ80017.1 DUF3850 domain-containing protein [Vibrio parahaemolyticus]TOZ99736.1 DUF3850 domain-containing protein [Vibrio parahaemolyticus]